MESATKAIIMAGTLILFGMYFVVINSSSNADAALEERIADEDIMAFNAHYTAFLARTDITPIEVVTMYNFTEDWITNNPMQPVTFLVDNRQNLGQTGKQEEIVAKFLKDNTKKYKIRTIDYDDSTGRAVNVK